MQVAAEYDLDNLLPNRSCSDKLAETAAKIAHINFEWRYITLVLFNSTLISGVEMFLRLYDKSYIVGKGLFYPHFAQSTQQYVLFGVDLKNVAQMVDWMARHLFDNTGKFIVVCQSEILNDCDETKAIQMFWEYKIINVMFIKSEECRVVGYASSEPSDDCIYGKPMKVVCPQTNEVPLISDFPEKLKNLHNCPLIVTTFIQTPYMSITNGKPKGTDGDLVRIIAEALNATLKMMTPRHGNGWGRIESDGTWSGSLADLLDDSANFSMTSAAITLARYSHFQMSISYYRSQVICIMHIAQMKPSSLKLFHPFQEPTEIVIGISFIIVTLFVWLIKTKYFNCNRTFTNPTLYYNNNETHDIIFYIWTICMGLPSPKLPSKRIFLHFTLLWIWYCYLIRTLYQVYLISSLQGNFYYEDINTLKDAFNANYSFGGGGALRDYFIDEPIIYDNWVVLKTDEIIPTLFEIAKGKKFVLAINVETAKALIKDNNILVHVLTQKIITSPAVLYYKKFSPLANPINTILQRLVESGFVKKFYKDYVTSIPTKRDDDGNEPIKLEHYTGCYVILIAGWLTSLLTCGAEICYKKMQYLLLHPYIN